MMTLLNHVLLFICLISGGCATLNVHYPLFQDELDSLNQFSTSGTPGVITDTFADCPIIGTGNSCAKLAGPDEVYMATHEINTVGYMNITLSLDLAFTGWTLDSDNDFGTEFYIRGYPNSIGGYQTIAEFHASDVNENRSYSLYYALADEWAANSENLIIKFKLESANASMVYIDNVEVYGDAIPTTESPTEPSAYPSAYPSTEPSHQPTESPSEPTETPTISPTDPPSESSEIPNIPEDDEISNKNATASGTTSTWHAATQYEYASYGFIAFSAVIIITSFIDARCIRGRRNDFYSATALMTAAFQIMDLLSDIFFAVKLLYLLLIPLFVTATVFIVVPIILSLAQLFVAVQQWRETGKSTICAWLLKYAFWLYALSLVTGSAFSGAQICRSDMFGLSQFSMPLNEKQIVEFQSKKLWTTVMLEVECSF